MTLVASCGVVPLKKGSGSLWGKAAPKQIRRVYESGRTIIQVSLRQGAEHPEANAPRVSAHMGARSGSLAIDVSRLAFLGRLSPGTDDGSKYGMHRREAAWQKRISCNHDHRNHLFAVATDAHSTTLGPSE